MNEILDLVQAVFLWVVLAVVLTLGLVAWALCRGAAIADRQLADPTPDADADDDLEDVARDTGVLRDLSWAHSLDEVAAQQPVVRSNGVPVDRAGGAA